MYSILYVDRNVLFVYLLFDKRLGHLILHGWRQSMDTCHKWSLIAAHATKHRAAHMLPSIERRRPPFVFCQQNKGMVYHFPNVDKK